MYPSYIKLSFWLGIEGKVDEVIILLDGFWSHQQFGDLILHDAQYEESASVGQYEEQDGCVLDDRYGRTLYIIVYYSFDNKVQHHLDLVVDLLQLISTCRLVLVKPQPMSCSIWSIRPRFVLLKGCFALTSLRTSSSLRGIHITQIHVTTMEIIRLMNHCR